MKCFHCGKELPDNSKFCSRCGEEQGFSKELTDRAAAGDQDAISELYRRTYAAAYKTAAILIKDEDAVLDIIQDSYVKAFQSLHQLKESDKFRAWVKRIAHNRAVDYLRKAKPVVFSQVSCDTDSTVDFEDDRTENLPETVIDQKETARLMGEILDTLSPGQRAVIAMYYYEQMSVRSIADLLQINENTVKSRLLHGRRNIEAAVKELEKQGTKLYSLSPVSFLLLLFRNWDAQPVSPPDAGLLSAILEQCRIMGEQAGGTAAAAGAANSGAAAAAGAAGKGLAAKILIGIVSCVILGGAVGTVTYFATSDSPEAKTEDNSETAGTQEPEDAEAPSYEPEEEVNYNVRQDPSDASIDPFPECFSGSDIPIPDAFFGLAAQNSMDTWEQNAEAYYGFLNPVNYDLKDEEGNPFEASPVDATECLDKLNVYLTQRGYGREPCFTDPDNGGTRYIWYKDNFQVELLVMAEDNIHFSALRDSGFYPETLEGGWEATYYGSDDGRNYLFALDFTDDGRVQYMIGEVQGEYFYQAIGTYTVEEDSLHLVFDRETFNDQEISLDCTYRFKAVNGILEMEYISGDVLNDAQDAGLTLQYSRAYGHPVYFDSQDNSIFVLSEDDEQYIREQLGVPADADVEFHVEKEYYWEGGSLMLIPVSIYQDGVYVAGADVNADTKEVVKSIFSYQN